MGEKLWNKLMHWPWKIAVRDVSGVVFHFAWGLGLLEQTISQICKMEISLALQLV